MVTGCSSSSSRQPSGAASDGGSVNVTFQYERTVKSGEEILDCQLLTLPSTLGPAAHMISASHEYTQGSHHLAVYTTDFTALPAGAGQVTDCLPDNQNNNSLNHARGVLYAAQTPTGTLNFPPGVGLPVSAGQVVLLNFHFVNPTPNDVKASANATLTINPDGAGITVNAGVLFWNDPYVAVPAGAQAHAQMRCPIPGDITVAKVVSHYHKRGVSYAAYIDPAPDQLATTPFYTSSNWEDPDVLNAIIPIAGGSAIRYRCDYDNQAGTSDFFEGASAVANEMCGFAATYYPDQGIGANLCVLGADMYGTGSTNCVDSAACLVKCPATPEPTGAYSPCTQKCMVNSCPTVSANLAPLVACIRQYCADECNRSSEGGAFALDAGAATDAGTDSCAACGAKRCPMETSACQQHTCP
jgi:hypothetical protein